MKTKKRGSKKTSSFQLSASINIQKSDRILREGVALQENGDIAGAEALFQKSLALNPQNHWSLYSLSVIAFKRLDYAVAVGLLDRAVVAAPQVARLWCALGRALVCAEQRLEALSSFEQAIKLEPNYIDALHESALVLNVLGYRGKAIERLEHILTIEAHVKTLANIAGIYGETANDESSLVKAIDALERLVATQPDYHFAFGRLTYQRLHICDWTNYASAIRRVMEGVQAGKQVCPPIPFMVMSSDSAEHQQCARAYAQFFFPPKSQPLWRGEHYQHKKIRVAYVSPDFGEHPVGQLMAGVLERHDKSRFETIAISMFSHHRNTQHIRLTNTFDHFIDAYKLGARQIAELMHQMEVDIAVDLAGYTALTGTPVFAHRPAPIQIAFLGYAGTIGGDFMDYILADRHVIPPEQQCYYNEKVLYLPDAYLPTDGDTKVSSRTPSRAECGLPESSFVFCAFSHDHKISPPLFDIWMRLLLQVPGSVLWLMSRLEISAQNLRKEAQARGVSPDRLIFAGRTPLLEDHLARYRQADLFLDTFPYNAHTTASDALMVGLPVITCMGNAFPSRVAGSLLYAVGMPELITHSLRDYENLALRLARDTVLLSDLRSKLIAARPTAPLFNTELFCRNLEIIFTQVYESQNSTQKHSGSESSADVLMRAIALQNAGQIDEAEKLLRQSIAQNSKDPLALHSLAVILMARPDLSAALDFLEFAVAMAPQFAPLWFARGVALKQSGRERDALASYDKALELDPNYIAALTNSCVLLQELKLSEAAQERYERLLTAKASRA